MYNVPHHYNAKHWRAAGISARKSREGGISSVCFPAVWVMWSVGETWRRVGTEPSRKHTHTIQHVWGQPRKFLAELIYAQDSSGQLLAARWKRCFALTIMAIWSSARCYILQCRSTHMHTHIMHSLRLHAVQLCALKYTAKVLYNTQYYLSPFCRCCCDSACWSSMAAEEEERKGWRWQRRDERQPSLIQLLSHLRALIHLHT